MATSCTSAHSPDTVAMADREGGDWESSGEEGAAPHKADAVPPDQQRRSKQRRKRRQRQGKVMGDVGGTRQGGKPRPLGQVKTENLYFQHAINTATRPTPLLPVTSHPELRRVQAGEEGLRASIKSMRELRENLRHAALLNIVAAANSTAPSYNHHHHHHHPEVAAAQDIRLQFFGTSPAQLPPPHHHKSLTSPVAPQGSSAVSPLPQTTERGGRSAGSHHSSKRDGGSPPLPQTLVANLLSPRIRTISIPRPGPRVNDLAGPFIHKSLSQAKECLSRVGEMVRSRTELLDRQAADGEREAAGWRGPEGAAGKENGLALPVQGHGLETPRSHTILHMTGRDKTRTSSVTATKLGSARSREATTASTLAPPNSASSTRSLTDGCSTRTGNRSARDGEEAPSSAQQVGSVRRHLTPGKKRELVKRLTEMAKCEAVDMSKPMVPEEAQPRAVPPMIIMSQQRQEIRHPEDSLPVASTHTPHHSALDGERQSLSREGSGMMYRAKSLSSLVAGTTHTHPPTSLRAKMSTPLSDKAGRLQRAQSGSMPDLVMEGGPPSTANTQHDMKRTDSSDWTAVTVQSFTDGIVGKTLLKEGDSGRKTPVESRPLLPATPKLRSRRGTRPSSRRSSQGLKDRGPLETVTPTIITTTSTIPGMSPTSSQSRTRSVGNVPDTPQPAEGSALPSKSLPVLTITGLNRERPPPGTPAANSRAARELRPTSRASVSNSMQLFQQLDDQCEKLQRQLNIGLNVPRRAPHWQSGTIIHTLPITRTDVSAHLQCVPLGEGRGTDPDSSSASSSSYIRYPQTRVNNGLGTALSDVEEQSNVGALNTHRTHYDEDGSDHFTRDSVHLEEGSNKTWSLKDRNRGGHLDQAPYAMADPVLQGKKEPRYQGFSSRVPESEARSQFHYVTPGSGSDAEDARDMKYRVLKALDQDVYYDFQHRKYRNTPASTAVVRCNNEEDRPRVHFYKVKVNGEL